MLSLQLRRRQPDAEGSNGAVREHGHLHDCTRTPTWASTVQVRYKGALIDGKVFDETKPAEPPAEFEAGGVIKGWQEALTMMKEGDKWNVVIPSDLAYGCKGKGERIKGDQVLVFDIELLKIK